MQHLTTETIINAPIEKVWSIFIDFDSYAEWNPFIKAIEGEMNVGNTLKVVLALGEKNSIFKPKLLRNEPNKEFRWKGSLGPGGLFDGEHYFLFEQLPDGTTKFIHGEKFSGLLVWPIMKMVGKDTHIGFNGMNKAIKERCENK